MTRKIVQIGVTAIGFTSAGDGDGLEPDLYALCDDGTLWNYWHFKWLAVLPIPQPGYHGHGGAGEDAPLEAKA